MTGRDLAAVAGIAVAAALLFGSDRVGRLDGLGIDTLFWLRQELVPAARPSADAPVAVIAIDEETYRRPPFKDTPQVMWTPQQAKILDAVLDAGATVVGFDIVYSTSVESYIPGYERDFLRSLHRGASDGRVLLSKAQHQEQPIEPFGGSRLSPASTTCAPSTSSMTPTVWCAGCRSSSMSARPIRPRRGSPPSRWSSRPAPST